MLHQLTDTHECKLSTYYTTQANRFIGSTQSLSIMEESKIPKDKWNFVFWVVFLIGFTILLPWNILITVEGFWHYKFRNVSLDSVEEANETLPDSDLQKRFGSYVAMASNVPNATFIILHAIIGHRISMKLRLYVSQVS